jgi:hypothetical protein
MNKLKSLLRMDRVTWSICAIVILGCAAFDSLMVPVSVQAQAPQPNPACPMYQAVQAAGGFQQWAAETDFYGDAQDGGGSGGTSCPSNIPVECICQAACGAVLCTP